MLGHGCRVSQYQQFYYQQLKYHQFHPYLGNFEGDNRKMTEEKWILDLAGKTYFFSERVLKNVN